MSNIKMFIIGALFMAVFLFLLNTRFFIPWYKENRELAAEIEKKRVSLKNLESVMGKSERLEKLNERIEETRAVLEELVPNEISFSRVHKKLTSPTGTSGVVPTSVSTGSVASKTDNALSYQSLPVDLGIYATMEGLVRYVAQFQGGSPYVRVDSLTITPVAEGPNSLHATIKLRTFSFTSSGGGQPPGEEQTESFDLARAEESISFSKTESSPIPQDSIRDPFVLPTPGGPDTSGASGTSESLSLSGIVLRPDSSCCLAVINRRLVEEGDVVSGYKVAYIGLDHVVLEQQGEKFVLRLGSAKKQGEKTAQ